MAQAAEKVPVRSYRGVIDAVERRIFRIDRWRIPKPDGLSVRALTYTVASFVALLVVGRLPVLGELLGLVPASARYVALPVLAGWGLSSWAPDGRAPHHALVSALRYLRGSKSLAGLRPCPPIGAELAPVGEVQLAHSGDESGYRPGRVKGPAVVTLRYPAAVGIDGVPRRARGSAEERAPHARRLTVTALRGGRALPKGSVLRVPAGKEVRFH